MFKNEENLEDFLMKGMFNVLLSQIHTELNLSEAKWKTVRNKILSVCLRGFAHK